MMPPPVRPKMNECKDRLISVRDAGERRRSRVPSRIFYSTAIREARHGIVQGHWKLGSERQSVPVHIKRLGRLRNEDCTPIACLVLKWAPGSRDRFGVWGSVDCRPGHWPWRSLGCASRELSPADRGSSCGNTSLFRNSGRSRGRHLQKPSSGVIRGSVGLIRQLSVSSLFRL